MHLKIQSIFPKTDVIRCEAQPYSILVFSEGWLKPKIKGGSILIEIFMPRNSRFRGHMGWNKNRGKIFWLGAIIDRLIVTMPTSLVILDL